MTERGVEMRFGVITKVCEPTMGEPMFTVGELLVLDGNDRDQMGRKPSEWDVTCDEFSDIESAVARARAAVSRALAVADGDRRAGR